jgi:hypothetical protein
VRGEKRHSAGLYILRHLTLHLALRRSRILHIASAPLRTSTSWFVVEASSIPQRDFLQINLGIQLHRHNLGTTTILSSLV